MLTKVLFLAMSVCTLMVHAQDRPKLSLERKKHKFRVVASGEFPQEDTLIWVIEPKGYASATRLSDKSKHAPVGFKHRPAAQDKEVWFPVVNFKTDSSYSLVLSFSGVVDRDSACWNGNFYDECFKLQNKVVIKDHLEYWENQIFVQSASAKLEQQHFEKIVPNTSVPVLEFEPLQKNWQGTISLAKKAKGKLVKIETVRMLEENLDQRKERQIDLSDASVEDALTHACTYLINAQNKNPQSPTYGGLYLFYDMDNQMYRRSDWMWSYGPSIRMLIDASKVGRVSKTIGRDKLEQSAREIAEASLRFQMLDKDHPAYGLELCRYDPRTDSGEGAEGFLSPADSYFLAGWGWMPYYNHSGDQRFLDASVLMTESIGKLLETEELIEQDYLLKEAKWKNWTMDESGFGMIGFHEVYAATGDDKFRGIGKKYIDGLLKYLERSDGLWDRTYHRNEADRADNGWAVGKERGTPVLIETKYSTRGLGWAMIGLLWSHKLLPGDNKYLHKAEKLAKHLMDNQAADGHWNFLFKDPQFEDEISAKGTTLWSLLFYTLYEHTRKPEHLATARKALRWCMDNQYLGTDPEAFGGIVEKNRESGVVYRRWDPLICSYTVSWYGLALLKELQIKTNHHF